MSNPQTPQGGNELVLVAKPGVLVNPATGQVLELAEIEDDALTGVAGEIKELKARLDEAQAEVKAEALRRMDRRASWTLKRGRVTLTGASPGVVSYNTAGLIAELNGLVEEGKIDPAARDAAIRTPEPKKEIRKAGVDALKKLGGEIADRIRLHEKPATSRKLDVKIEPPR